MAEKRSKPKQVIVGPRTDAAGEVAAEDGGEVTPALEEIYAFSTTAKEETQRKEYTNRTPLEVQLVGDKSITSEILEVPKVCENCYLQDKCPKYDIKATCFYRTQVRLDNPEDMVNLLKMLLEMQGERIIFGRFIEQMEGGYVDRNLSEEIRRIIDMMKDFKEIFNDKEEISIRVRGKEAVKQAGGGVLSQIFSGGKKDE